MNVLIEGIILFFPRVCDETGPHYVIAFHRTSVESLLYHGICFYICLHYLVGNIIRSITRTKLECVVVIPSAGVFKRSGLVCRLPTNVVTAYVHGGWRTFVVSSSAYQSCFRIPSSSICVYQVSGFTVTEVYLYVLEVRTLAKEAPRLGTPTAT